MLRAVALCMCAYVKFKSSGTKLCMHALYCIAQFIDGKNIDRFDTLLATCQVFPLNIF